MGKKILVITDMDSNGSGYRNICIPLFTELSKLDYDTKVVGLMYRGEEHYHPFSIIPAGNVQEMVGIGKNLIQMWWPDVVIVAMDIPLQINIYGQLAPLLQRTPPEVQSGFKEPRKYVAITPLENGPLTVSWAIPLMNMDKVFFISELGKREAEKVGMRNAEHLIIGVDTVIYHPATPEEKSKLREGLGIPQDAFVILTVADNQERKNLSASLEAIAILKNNMDASGILEHPAPASYRPIRYILVTREQNPYGWRLKDMIQEFGIRDEVILFERGMPVVDLWGLYSVSDVYVQPSKAEGLGMPVLDAMACKIPVVATDTGAMTELLENNRGILCPSALTFRDVWGNSKRDMIDIFQLSDRLYNISTKAVYPDIETAWEYVKARTWDVPAGQLDKTIKELLP